MLTGQRLRESVRCMVCDADEITFEVVDGEIVLHKFNTISGFSTDVAITDDGLRIIKTAPPPDDWKKELE